MHDVASINAEKVIIGSGLLANAFKASLAQLSHVWIYAAGVSNSNCADIAEFERERKRLTEALNQGSRARCFVYFSTCSIFDPIASQTPYVYHKIEMEKLVSEHSNFIIARLPQVAGLTPNPHTLLNYLYAKISRSEKFYIWKNATRNIIDVEDAVSIMNQLIEEPQYRRVIINVANQISYPIAAIVSVLEKVIGKQAITETVNKGNSYNIDTSKITGVINKLGLSFDNGYVYRVARKYYGQKNTI